MDVAALTVAIVGVVLGGFSLGWQVLHYLLTGARVRVKFQYAMLGPGGAITWPVDAKPQLDHAAQQGYTERAFAVEVVNRGRMAVDVDRVKVKLSGGVQFEEPQSGWNPTMPYRLEPQSRKTFYVTAAPVMAAAEVSRKSGMTSGPVDAWGIATLGTGDEVVADDKARLLR